MYAKILQLSQLTILTRHYLKTKEFFNLDLPPLLRSFVFDGLEGKPIPEDITTLNEQLMYWLKVLEHKGIIDVGLYIAPPATTEAGLTDFPCLGIVCQNDMENSIWTPQWQYFPEVYKHELWLEEKKTSLNIPMIDHFQLKEELIRVLEELEAFADSIQSSYFGICFLKARNALLAKELLPAFEIRLDCLTAEQRQMYIAFTWLKVLGGVGSWFHHPMRQACIAREKDRYEKLTAQIIDLFLKGICFCSNGML